jgi:hypothetical protein
VQSTQRHENTLGAVVIRDAISAIGVGDIDLDQDQVGLVVNDERRNMLVNDLGMVVRAEIGGDGRKPERAGTARI